MINNKEMESVKKRRQENKNISDSEDDPQTSGQSKI